MLQWNATNAAKFLIIALGTFGFTLLLYLFIQRFFVLRVLFGLKPLARAKATVDSPALVRPVSVARLGFAG